ncbi:MAG: zinc-dependent alcohol dehydrogenase family protein [Acidobacteriota bacterium]
MRAQRLHQIGPIDAAPLRWEEIDPPRPGAGEILIRVEACGICHTDLHIVEGEIPLHRVPLIPGHQVVGTVESCGPGAARFAPGARVGVAWLHGTCGACLHCKGGTENLCQGARFTGYDADGGYAELALAPEAFAHLIPQRFDAVAAAPLLCAGIIGYRALRLSDLRRGERLALFGFGASAHLALQVARSWDCEVDVYTRAAAHRELALALGARRAVPASEAAEGSADRAILFAPAGSLIPPALRALRRGGTLAIASIYLDRIPEIDYGELLYGERTLRSVTAATRQDAEEFLQEAASIPVRAEIETFPMSDANTALGLLKHSRIRGAGVLVPD